MNPINMHIVRLDKISRVTTTVLHGTPATTFMSAEMPDLLALGALHANLLTLGDVS